MKEGGVKESKDATLRVTYFWMDTSLNEYSSMSWLLLLLSLLFCKKELGFLSHIYKFYK